ncbi:hypothetical protein YC2023_012398 [Brassica napus]
MVWFVCFSLVKSSMNGSLEKTRVLYAPVEEVGDEGRLLRAYTIIDAFANAGFAGRDAKLHLKLHVTLMNTTYRRDERKSNTFDAREIHKEFGGKDWGEYLIREAQISKRFWYDADGYFHCCDTIIDAFANAGFAGRDAKLHLKLHVTLMNTTYRRDERKSNTFDAREIHKEFGGKDWGEYLIREAQISKRFWYDADGYFHCCGSLPFPH